MSTLDDDLLDDPKPLETEAEWLPWAIAGAILVIAVAAVILVRAMLWAEASSDRTIQFSGQGVRMISLRTPVYYNGDLVGQINEVDVSAERAFAHLSTIGDSRVFASIDCESRWLPGPPCIRLWPAHDRADGNDVIELRATTWLNAHIPLPGFAIISGATLLGIGALVVAGRTLQRFVLLLSVLRALVALAVVCIWGWPILGRFFD